MLIQIGLINPPSGATKWQVVLMSGDLSQSVNWGIVEHSNIQQAATFDIPADWVFPLCIDIGIYVEWQEDSEWVAQQLYRIQSWSPDSDYYKEVFVPDYGTYTFNVATEQLQVGQVPSIADWIPMIMLVMVLGMIMPMMEEM